tara:strand:+ start:162 stop:773 length:612 start_codon:yes stop_codon:yes gene_type:complete
LTLRIDNTTVNIKKLHEYKNSSSRDLIELEQFFHNLEKFTLEGIIPPTFASFEIIESLVLGLELGHKYTDLLKCLPHSLGSKTVAVPISILAALSTAWFDYKKSPTLTMGRAFQLKEKHTGKRPAVSKMNSLKTDRYYARQVLFEYYAAQNSKQKISALDAQVKISEDEKVSFSTVKNAYTKHKNVLINEFLKHGIINIKSGQ